MKKLILATILLAASNTALATDWIDLHLVSKHSEQSYVDAGRHEYNEDNYGLGIALAQTPNVDAIAGFYKNSFDKTSAYGGIALHTNNKRLASAGVMISAVTGYDNTPVSPSGLIKYIMIPTISVNYNNSRIKIGYIPAKISVLTLSFGVKF